MGTTLIIIQLILVLLLIFIGARVGGIGFGVYGMIGVFILVFVFGLKPGSAPIDVMLMIIAVVTAASALQAAGGLDYLVRAAEHLLRKHPNHITFLGPTICYIFTLIAGTGHTSYSVLPIISEVATETKVRPERPLSVSVIASQQAITASPVSAATAALLSQSLLGGKGIELIDILLICIPATFIGVMIAAFVENFIGTKLEKDPEYIRRVQSGELSLRSEYKETVTIDRTEEKRERNAVWVFLIGVALVILFGSMPSLRPSFINGGETQRLGMPEIIEIIMMGLAAIILLISKADVHKAVTGSVFTAGMQAVIAIFGIAWMGDTFFGGNIEFFKTYIESAVTAYPFLFAIAVFVMSILLFSQAATVRTLYPLGLALGINPLALVAMFPAANGYFFIPNYPTIVAAINFDRTGTTRIGKYVLNHSFQLPGWIATVSAIIIGYLIITAFY